MELKKWIVGFFGQEEEKVEITQGIDKTLFDTILDTDPRALLFFTKEQGWTGANKTFFDFFSINSMEEFHAHHASIRELFCDEDEEVFTEHDKSWLDYIRTNCPNGYGLGILDQKGKRHAMLATLSVLHQSSGDMYLLALEDRTHILALEEEVAQVEAIKTKFLANIGHEFRTPMNGILGFVDLLSKTSPTETQMEYIRSIQGSSRNLMSNIENLLDLAQMQTGRLTINHIDFNMIAEMEEFALDCVSLGQDKGMRVVFFLDPKLPMHLVGDIRKIKQALSNLYNNALKFTPPHGHITIEIKLLKRNAVGSVNIGFSVKDTGKGISRKDLGFITQPFVSGDQADNRLGVGLSISHGLINLMGGELKIVSEEGRGSSFSCVLTLKGSSDQSMRMINGYSAKVVLLDEKRLDDANHLSNYLSSFGLSITKSPLIDETVFHEMDVVYFIASQEKSDWILTLSSFQRRCKTVLLLEQHERLLARTSQVIDYVLTKPLLPTTLLNHLVEVLALSKENVPVIAQLQQGLCALVVEDNLINQRLITLLLEEYGLSVVTTSNGDEAVEACRNQRFDIVFMDIDMPIKNGILATQEIKAEQGNVHGKKRMPIIASTALAMDGDREYFLEKGLDDYLSKPITREKLEYILQKYLHVSTE